MAKVKSAKFYNFTNLSATYRGSFNARFYDSAQKLILIDILSNCTYQSNLAETSEYIFTASRCAKNQPVRIASAFNTGNLIKTSDLKKTYGTWDPDFSQILSSDWIKIEFKFPQYISEIKILHSFASGYDGWGFNTCDYDIEYEDGVIETNSYISNGELNPIHYDDIENNSYDQDLMDAQFDSIEFSKPKQIYNSKIGYIETLDTNNFRNIPVNTVEKLKVLYAKPNSTILNCLVSFDKKQTWKTFNGNNWVEVSNISGENIILNCMGIDILDGLNKNQLILGGFTGDLDFKIVMKSNNENKTPSVSKIYIEYK